MYVDAGFFAVALPFVAAVFLGAAFFGAAFFVFAVVFFMRRTLQQRSKGGNKEP